MGEEEAVVEVLEEGGIHSPGEERREEREREVKVKTTQ